MGRISNLKSAVWFGSQITNSSCLCLYNICCQISSLICLTISPSPLRPPPANLKGTGTTQMVSGEMPVLAILFRVPENVLPYSSCAWNSGDVQLDAPVPDCGCIFTVEKLRSNSINALSKCIVNLAGNTGGDNECGLAKFLVRHVCRPFAAMTLCASTRNFAHRWICVRIRFRGNNAGGWIENETPQLEYKLKNNFNSVLDFVCKQITQLTIHFHLSPRF